MPRYDRNYDYGLRGEPDRPLGAEGHYTRESDRRHSIRPRRVTAAYNEDYVFGGRGSLEASRRSRYARDYDLPIESARGYRAPYLTIGGTRTYRGTSEPPYDREFMGF